MGTTAEARSGRSASSARAMCGMRAQAGTLAGFLGVLLLCAFAGLPRLEASEPKRAARLQAQRWAAAADCDKPLRTRVTDRFLGFTCTEGLADAVTCRAFLPPPGSSAFDTSRNFRCVDFAVTDTELGPVVTAMREWAEPSKTCDWSRSGELPFMQVDFGAGRTCVMPGGLCISVPMLTAIGKVRLRQSIEKALREFGMVPSDGPRGAEDTAEPAAWALRATGRARDR
jgi:hypothetical protein